MFKFILQVTRVLNSYSKIPIGQLVQIDPQIFVIVWYLNLQLPMQ